MRTQHLLIVLSAILVVSGCSNDDVARVIDPPTPTTDEQIIADSYALRDALEAFAAENGGVYPLGLNDQSDAGHTFITFLPNDTRLTNQYTGLATAPIFHDPQWPGEIGVEYFGNFSDPSGYRVIAQGRDSELIRLENFANLDPRTVTAYDSVLANVAATAAAADEFRRQAGEYPLSVGGDELPSGDTMTDLLPGGEMLMNPFIGIQADPVDGPAGHPGGVGYTPWDRDGNGSRDSYMIDASAEDGVTTILVRMHLSDEEFAVSDAALALRWAVEEFANNNDGGYPSTVEEVQEAAGDYMNPYTNAPAYRDGLATSRGEVGYLPVVEGNVVVGYVINALGLFNEELERFEVLTN